MLHGYRVVRTGSARSTVINEIYYGPVLIPNIHHFIERLFDKEDVQFFNGLLSTRGYERCSDIGELKKRCDDIFERNRDLFLSGHGAYRVYLAFRYVTEGTNRKEISDKRVSEILRNTKFTALGIYRTHEFRSRMRILRQRRDEWIEKRNNNNNSKFITSSTVNCITPFKITSEVKPEFVMDAADKCASSNITQSAQINAALVYLARKMYYGL